MTRCIGLRAEEARALAKTMDDDPDAKQRMLAIAESYDHVAELAQKRRKRGKPE